MKSTLNHLHNKLHNKFEDADAVVRLKSVPVLLKITSRHKETEQHTCLCILLLLSLIVHPLQHGACYPSRGIIKNIVVLEPVRRPDITLHYYTQASAWLESCAQYSGITRGTVILPLVVAAHTKVWNTLNGTNVHNFSTHTIPCSVSLSTTRRSPTHAQKEEHGKKQPPPQLRTTAGELNRCWNSQYHNFRWVTGKIFRLEEKKSLSLCKAKISTRNWMSPRLICGSPLELLMIYECCCLFNCCILALVGNTNKI